MLKITLAFIVTLLTVQLHSQPATIPVPENLITEGIPALPKSISEEVKPYTESRSATLVDWHPLRKEMLISTRFGNSNQLHYVKNPDGDRKQITFFDEPVSSATFDPVKGEYFLFLKDIGGNEFSQIYRFDWASQKSTLLTDGKKSQNGGIQWSHKGDRIAFAGTQRNGKDRDIIIMNPLAPTPANKIIENMGGGWSVSCWSKNDAQLLLTEGISVNETRLYLADVKTGVKTRLLPDSNERSTYRGICFSNDGEGIYLTTNKESEYDRLAYFHIPTKILTYITSDIPWDVSEAEESPDGTQIAFTCNENGYSRMYLFSTLNKKYNAVPEIPGGVIGSLVWSGDSKSIGIHLVTYKGSDVYEFNTAGRQLIRWTESELGGINKSALQAPRLITWNSFDGTAISGYQYPAAKNFTGKRPVIINIHGGPEGQSRPNFIASANYYLNELGIALIYPNVRGSTGYGKTYTDMDNGMKREESVKDIGALLDWISAQPDLDASRVMVAGGSYGGYMSLAVSYLYSDKIRCSVDIVGISNFNTFLKNTESYRRDLRRVEYGNEQDTAMAAFFERISPLNHTDKIKKPLLIVQGGNDPRVPYTESVQMKDKIKQAGGSVWFLMAKDEGHGFRKKNNMDYQFYTTVAFVKEYLVK